MVSFKELGLVNTREMFAKAASGLDFALGKFDIELVNDVLADTFRKAEELTDRFISL